MAAPTARVSLAAVRLEPRGEATSLASGVAVVAEARSTRCDGSAEDVADAVLYLVRAGFVTGQEILVDGGVAMTGRPSGEG